MNTLTLPYRTWAHAVPAGAKLACLLVAALVLVPLDDPAPLLVALAAVLALHASFGRMALARLARAARPILLIVAIAAGFHLWQGRPSEGAAMALRLLTLWGLAVAVTMTTRLDDLVAFVERVAAPLARFGLPPRALGLSVALVIRFIPAFIDRWDRLRDGWRARSARRPGVRLVAPLMISVLDDAAQVSDAIMARGGIAPSPRRNPDDGTFARPDRPVR